MKNETYESTYKENNHFSFGRNWQHFLKTLTDEKIEEAKQSLIEFLEKDCIDGKTFIDIGCGSGLFSLAAYKLGAKRVLSVDVDEFSLACTTYLRKKEGNPENWIIREGSALDATFTKSLGRFDIVYSWGVLHHTGDMYKAFFNLDNLVATKGKLFLAIYNKYTERFRGGTSQTWLLIKKTYNKSNRLVKKMMEFIFATYLIAVRIILLENPYKYIKNYQAIRGMTWHTDLVDWIGGYPYEFASVDEIINFFSQRDFLLKKIKSCDGTGCNEFLFIRE